MNKIETITKGELISQVKNELNLNNSDSRLTNRFIWSIIDKHAQWLIKREARKFRLYNQDSLFQTYKCVDVEDAPAVDSCCGIRTKCKVFRTAHKLPDMFESDTGVIIRSVYTIDGSKDFSPISIQDYMRKLEDPNSKYDQSLYFFYNSGYLYFPKSRIRKVMIKAYFKKELDQPDCEECNSKVSCISMLDSPIRLPKYLVAELMQFVLNELASFTLKIQGDEDINKNENRKN